MTDITLHCHRVQDIPESLRCKLLQKFQNKRNFGLVLTLTQYKTSDAIYYLVYSEEQPLFYFSLKASSLFRSEYSPDTPEAQHAEKCLQVIQSLQYRHPNLNKSQLQQALLAKGLYDPLVHGSLDQVLEQADQAAEYREEQNAPYSLSYAIYKEAIPCIELTEFCKCDSKESLAIWGKMNLSSRPGKFVFFHYIMPIVLEVAQKIGSRAVMLYAADLSSTGTLITNYIEQLSMVVPKDIVTHKPLYDMGCTLLMQDIHVLEQKTRSFEPFADTVDTEKTHLFN